MKPKKFIEILREWNGVTAVGPSALRGQGKGVLKRTQDFLGRIELSKISSFNKKQYMKWLDKNTENLLDFLRIKPRPWGAARKALNLYMRNVLYNQYLNRHFKAKKIEKYLEIPLDRVVATALICDARKGALPKWPGLKHLDPKTSKIFQNYAAKCAQKYSVNRVHLDVYLWLENR